MAAGGHRTLLIRPEDLSPTRDDFQVVGTFNPGVAQVGDDVVLLVRVAEQPRLRRDGFTALPRWCPDGELAVDWVANDALEPVDPRVVRYKADGLVRLTFISHLRALSSTDGMTFDRVDRARFVPQTEWEEYGVEDARLTFLRGRWYFTYVAVSRHGVATALASTTDFTRFERHGILFCPENKDVVLFPERIGGQFVALHRPNAATPFTPPEMWLARSPDLIHWGRHEQLHGGASSWEADRIGAGTPPLRVAGHWLEIYHGSRSSAGAGQVGTYSAGALLLDGEDPARVLRRSGTAVMAPEAEFEREGFVPNVVFPTGVIRHDDALRIYYGAADTFTAVMEVSCRELLASLGGTPAG